MSVVISNLNSKPKTRDLAYAACGDIFLEKAVWPTVDLVCERIGSQNRRLVSEVIKLWRRDLAERLRKQQLEVPEPVRQFWRQALKAANQALAEEHEALKAARQALESERKHLEQEIDAARREAASLKEQLEQVIQERDSAKASVDRLKGHLDEMRDSLTRSERRLAEVRAWAQEHVETEKQRLTKQWQDRVTQSEQEASRLRQEFSKAEKRIDVLLGYLRKQERDLEQLAGERDRLAKQVESLTVQLQSSQKELACYQEMATARDAIARLPQIKRLANEAIRELGKNRKAFKGEAIIWQQVTCNEVRLHMDDDGNCWFEIYILRAHPDAIRFQRALREYLESKGFEDVQVSCQYALE